MPWKFFVREALCDTCSQKCCINKFFQQFFFSISVQTYTQRAGRQPGIFNIKDKDGVYTKQAHQLVTVTFHRRCNSCNTLSELHLKTPSSQCQLQRLQTQILKHILTHLYTRGGIYIYNNSWHHSSLWDLLLSFIFDPAGHCGDQCCSLSTSILWLQERHLTLWRQIPQCFLHDGRET